MFSSILVTLDDSSQAPETLTVARTVASASGGSLTLLRVVPRLAMVLAAEAESDLKATAHELGGDGLQVDVVVRHGEPATEILREVLARSVELIVTGTRLHGQRAARRSPTSPASSGWSGLLTLTVPAAAQDRCSTSTGSSSQRSYGQIQQNVNAFDVRIGSKTASLLPVMSKRLTCCPSPTRLSGSWGPTEKMGCHLMVRSVRVAGL